MLFKSLTPLLAGVASLSLILTAGKNGDIHVAVIPVPKEDGHDDAALKEPLTLTASPDELDEKFVEAMAKFTGARSGLEEQLDVTLSVIGAATKAAATKANTAVRKGAAKAAAPAVKVSPALCGNNDDDNEGGDGADTPTSATASAAPAVEVNLFT